MDVLEKNLRYIYFIGSLCLILLTVVACQGGTDAADAFAALPEGSAERGEALFTESIEGAPTCISCHALDDQRMIGPGMAGYAQRAATTVADQGAGPYSYIAIVNPSAHIADGYGNLMYTEYRSRLDEQQIADLIAYMLSFEGDG